MDDALAEKTGEGDGLSAGGLPAVSALGVAPLGPTPSGHLGHRARLRRRLVGGGPAALLDHELLEMVLFLALPRRDTKPIALALMRRFGGFAGAISAPPGELDGVGGLGEPGVAALKAVEAAALRLGGAGVAEPPVLDTSERLLGYLTVAPARGRVEGTRVLFLDGRGRLIADETGARDAAAHAPAYPREVVLRALEVGATALVLVRDNPGDDGTSSRADMALAAAVKAAAAVFGIALHDHLVVGRGRHTSLRREGLL